MTDAAETAKARLRRGLRSALQASSAGETEVPRYAVHQFGDRSAEVSRLSLDDAEAGRLLELEVASRTADADKFVGLGRPERAAELRAEAAIVLRYLTSRTSSVEGLLEPGMNSRPMEGT